MNQQRLFRRKIAYFVAIAVLLFPLYWLSQPATTQSEGGKLAQLRTKHQLGQADLGQIDPTSASMKLASFGLDGIAANILWSRAIKYKMREDYTSFNAALEQITHLQPHFIKVWEFQGHNVAFNISVEFDDYRDRYHYVTKGFNLIKKGIRHNEKSAKLIRSLAHYTGFKIGRSDEKKFFRVLYREDDDYHAPPPDKNWLLGTRYENRSESMRDNWLVSKWWYREAEKLVDTNLIPMGTMNPFLLYSDAARQQMQYAEGLEKDGHFGEIARQAWRKGGEEWEAFGRQAIKTSFGFPVRLTDLNLKKCKRLVKNLADQFDQMQPGLQEEMRKDVLDGLTDEETLAWDKTPETRTESEATLANKIEASLRFGPQKIAAAMNLEHRAKALQLADRLDYARLRLRMVEGNRDTVNYEYWRQRCEFEQSADAVAARQAIYQAKVAYRATDLPTAQTRFEEGLALWRKVLDQYPFLLEEEMMIEDLMETITDGYQVLLSQIRDDGSQELPDDFPLQEVVDRWEAMQPEIPSAP